MDAANEWINIRWKELLTRNAALTRLSINAQQSHWSSTKGYTRQQAAENLGMDISTLDNWLRQHHNSNGLALKPMGENG